MELDYINFAISIIFGLFIWQAYKDYIAPSHDKYLTFWPRFWAPTIDELVLWIPTSLIPFLIYKMFDLGQNMTNLLSCTVYFIYYLYSIYFHGAYGATIGKMTTKVKVVDANTEGPITFKQAIIRDSVPVIFSIVLTVYILLTGDDMGEGDSEYSFYMSLIFLFWFLAEILTMLTNMKRRALHDYIAGTVVIRSNIEEPLFATKLQ